MLRKTVTNVKNKVLMLSGKSQMSRIKVFMMRKTVANVRDKVERLRKKRFQSECREKAEMLRTKLMRLFSFIVDIST